MSDISEALQPVEETSQETLDPGEAVSSYAEVTAAEEEIIPEMEYSTPSLQETIEEETNPGDTVSIETLPDAIPEQEDQASVTIEFFPEVLKQEGQEAITPVE